MIICLTCCTPNDPGAAACVLCGAELPEQQPLFTEPSGTNIYPEPNPDDMFFPPDDPARGDCHECNAPCDVARAATEPANAAPLQWDDPTDWIDGQVIPHYVGWYDVQMRSRFNDEHAAEGITRFWFAGRDWFTGPNAMDVGAPAVPRGNIFHWRGRVKP